MFYILLWTNYFWSFTKWRTILVELNVSKWVAKGWGEVVEKKEAKIKKETKELKVKKETK